MTERHEPLAQPACAPSSPDAPDDASASLVIAAKLLRDVALQPRPMLLDPILARASLTLLCGPRGIGKTYLALSMALAVAGAGSALRWRAAKPARVLYVDGEMPRQTLLERLAGLAAGARIAPAGDNLRLLAAEGDGRKRPELGTRQGRALIESAIGDGVDLLVLDSLAVLMRGRRVNPGRAWLVVEDWLLDLRRRGIAVLVVRNGSPGPYQCETTRHADVVDTAIALHHPADYGPLDGARFVVQITKGRALYGLEARPFEAMLDEERGALSWMVFSPEDALVSRAVGLFAEDFTVREVAARLGISKSHAHRLRAAGHERIRRFNAGLVPSGTDPESPDSDDSFV
jgi:putative DNA primase/helicase